MKTRFGFVLIAVCALLLSGSGALAGSLDLPDLPGIDPQTAAIDLAAKQLAPYVVQQAPVIRDWNALYPRVQDLPGGPFHPDRSEAAMRRTQTRIIAQLHAHPLGEIALPPGDYEIPVRVFCTDIGRHAMSPEVYQLGPLRGTRAAVLQALYARDAGEVVPSSTLQMLSWSLQAGMKYDELGDEERNAVDRLIPEYRNDIAGSFLEQIQDKWDSLASSIPGLPSLDDALDRLGSAGTLIRSIQDARDEIASSADNYQSLAQQLAPRTSATSAGNAATPWSRVAPGRYERLITGGAFGSIGVLQLRILKSIARVAQGAAYRIADAGESGAGAGMGYPPDCTDCQPLTFTPAGPGSTPDPPVSDAPPSAPPTDEPTDEPTLTPLPSPSESPEATPSDVPTESPNPKPSKPPKIKLKDKKLEKSCLDRLVAASRFDWRVDASSNKPNKNLRDGLQAVYDDAIAAGVFQIDQMAYLLAAAAAESNAFRDASFKTNAFVTGVTGGTRTGDKLDKYVNLGFADYFDAWNAVEKPPAGSAKRSQAMLQAGIYAPILLQCQASKIHFGGE